MRSIGYFLKLFARWTVVTLSVSLLLFVMAGTMRPPSLRHYLVTYATLLLAAMLSVDPDLAKERSRSFENTRTPGRFAAGLSFLTTLSTTALDVGRLHRFDTIPAGLRLGSLILFGAATALEIWAMIVNPFFLPDIRLQPERRHHVVTSGPYRTLRHPGYLAMLVSVPASALAIGSWLGLVPAAAFCLVILRRVRAEEKFLQNNLIGYSEYMRQVRGRLFPRIVVHRLLHGSSVATEFELRGTDRRWP